MRFVFIGASALTIRTARILVDRGHEVVIIERDKETLEALADNLDCGFLHGDGGKPSILREVGPKATHVLFCLTSDDHANIVASLVGRSLGFPRVITRIEDDELQHVCLELGLEDVIIPDRTMGRYLAELAVGRDVHEISALIKGDADVFSFVAREEDQVRIQELGLPELARVTCIYRNDEFLWPESDTKLKKGDEVVLMIHRNYKKILQERWGA
ncbi:potassium channel family protein [Nitrosococcus wardiae]|uniref:TrkA family potassium uptake protein n=1 Tax=Nitrosococcus wardiae TaxID=1814290 RepID=A0A4V1AW21_9GAMM|nr:TrkA family potassium uptake protein [Nitrosococcus wardiae]QBQ55115.1 TrkA family potassium uptake protein [Nitrosococcus wardiae]